MKPTNTEEPDDPLFPKTLIREPFPTVFVRDFGFPLYAKAFAIPFVFMVLKHADIPLLSQDVATALAAGASWFWPALPETIVIMRNNGLGTDAVNYVAFFFVLFACNAYIFQRVIRAYLPQISEMKLPDPVLDTLIIGLGVLGYWMYSNKMPTLEMKSIRDFYLDRAGFFYLSSYVTISVGYVALLIATLSVIKICHRLLFGSKA